MRRILVIVMVSAAALAALPASGHAAAKYANMDVTLASPVEPLTFDLAIESGVDCASDFAVTSVQVDGVEVTPVSVTPDATDANAGTLVLPSSTPGGTLSVMAQCTVVSGGPVPALGERKFAAIGVTKAVTGAVPADATFTVHVECTPRVGGDEVDASVAPAAFAVDLAYPAKGGVHYVYLDDAHDCAVTEPGTGGALTTDITPGTVAATDPQSYAVTVTNTFPAAVAPTAAEVTPGFTG